MLCDAYVMEWPSAIGLNGKCIELIENESSADGLWYENYTVDSLNSVGPRFVPNCIPNIKDLQNYCEI